MEKSAEKVIINMKQWMVRFLQNKDLILKQIKEIKEEEKGVRVFYKDGREQELIVVPELEDTFDFSQIKEGHKGIIAVNNQKNFDFIVKNWQKLVQNKNFIIYFINPFSKQEKRWAVYPYTHNRVTEGEKIKEGLLSLYINVDPITFEEYQKIVEQ